MIVALLVGMAYRLTVGWLAPFWLDEVYSGVIASQPSVGGLFDWCRNELSGPVFYAGLWVWEKVAGNGDTVLRLPSLIFSLAAPALILAKGGGDRRERWLWAGLTALWLPGLAFASQARPQALLLLLATAQAIAFLRCVQSFSRRRLAVWSAMGTLLLLTHLYAGLITGIQLLCLFWVHRDRWRDLWPAPAIFAVAAAWLPLQLPILLAFSRPGVAWYPALSVHDLAEVPLHLLGANNTAYAVLGVVILVVALQASRRSLPYARGETMLILSGLASISLIIIMGLFRPSFAPRYLIPYMPSVLFGLACVLRRAPRLSGLLPSLLLATWIGAAVQKVGVDAPISGQQKLNPLEFERASNWLMQAGVHRVIFVWDNPTSVLSGPKRQSQLGEFFFRRAGYPADVKAIFLPSLSQGAAHLAWLAAKQDASILWVGGATYPAGLGRMHRFDCRLFGGNASRSIACRRSTASISQPPAALQAMARSPAQ